MKAPKKCKKIHKRKKAQRNQLMLKPILYVSGRRVGEASAVHAKLGLKSNKVQPPLLILGITY